MRRRDVSSALLAAAASSALLSERANAQSCTLPCYPRTSRELAAGVLPSNYEHPPGNALRYGASGSGATNDQPAIQQAINSNDEVFLPPGTYRLDAGLTLHSGLRISGANLASTILRAGTSGITMLAITGGHNRIDIRDLQIYGHGLAAVGFSSVSPSQGSSSGMTLDNVAVSSCTDKNIYIKNMTYASLRNVHSAGYTGTTNSGLYLDSCYNFSVQDGLFYDCAVAALTLFNCSHVDVVGTTVFNNASITAPRLCLVDRSVACGFIRCTFEAQGSATVTAELELDSSSAPNCVSTYVENCSFVGVAASKSYCVRIGVNGTVYKTSFRNCRFFKPSGNLSILSSLQQHSLLDDCQDITSYAQTAYVPVSYLNNSPHPVHVVQPR